MPGPGPLAGSGPGCWLGWWWLGVGGRRERTPFGRLFLWGPRRPPRPLAADRARSPSSRFRPRGGLHRDAGRAVPQAWVVAEASGRGRRLMVAGWVRVGALAGAGAEVSSGPGSAHARSAWFGLGAV